MPDLRRYFRSHFLGGSDLGFESSDKPNFGSSISLIRNCKQILPDERSMEDAGYVRTTSGDLELPKSRHLEFMQHLIGDKATAELIANAEIIDPVLRHGLLFEGASSLWILMALEDDVIEAFEVNPEGGCEITISLDMLFEASYRGGLKIYAAVLEAPLQFSCLMKQFGDGELGSIIDRFDFNR